MSNEIVTIQLGKSANFVGAHWWNLQESSFIFDPNKAQSSTNTRLNHDVMFREGRDVKQDFHYTPRLIVIEDKSNIGYNPALHCLQCSFTDESDEKRQLKSWNNNPTVIDQVTNRNDNKDLLEFSKSCNSRMLPRFNQLDEKVKTWTDFLHVPLHPKSIMGLADISNDSIMTKFQDGYDLSQTGSFLDQLESKFRFFVEECDHIQGINLLCDVQDAFSGVGSSVLQYIREELNRTAVFCIPLFAENLLSQEKSQNANFMANVSIAISNFLKGCDLILPLSVAESWDFVDSEISYRHFPLLKYKPSLLYHTTAILASALETATTPWRLFNKTSDMNGVCSYLNEFNRKIASCDLSIPNQPGNFTDFVSLLPYYYTNEVNLAAADTYSRFVYTVRGIQPSGIEANQEIARIREMIESSFTLKKKSSSEIFISGDFISTKNPTFPGSIFHENVDVNGIFSSIKRSGDQGVHKIGTICGLETSQRNISFLAALLDNFSNLDAKKMNMDTELTNFVKETLIASIDSS